MNTLRLLLTLLMSLALPVNGYAALSAVTPCCPMQHEPSVAAMPMGQACCCHHGDPADKQGYACKCAHLCSTANPFPTLSATSVFFPLPYWQPVPQSSVRVISFDASGVWRPPRLL